MKAREQCQHVSPVGVALGARGELVCCSMASGSVRAEGPGGPEGPAEVHGSVVVMALAALAAGVAAVDTAVVAAAAREGPFIMAGGAGCVVGSTAGVGGTGRAVEGGRGGGLR